MNCCKVHEAIIAKGFREVRSIAGSAKRYGSHYTVYERGEYRVQYADYGPNQYQPHAPDSNRYVMQLFKDGRKVSGGTAWYAILERVPEELCG